MCDETYNLLIQTGWIQKINYKGSRFQLFYYFSKNYKYVKEETGKTIFLKGPGPCQSPSCLRPECKYSIVKHKYLENHGLLFIFYGYFFFTIKYFILIKFSWYIKHEK
jgi:hypothetical protein